MREIRQSGSEGGGVQTNALSLPLSFGSRIAEGLGADVAAARRSARCAARRTPCGEG